MIHFIRILFFSSFLGLYIPFLHSHLNVDRLSDTDIAISKAILKKTETLISKKNADGSLCTLKWQELYEPLNKDEKKFLDSLKSLKPGQVGVKTPFQGMAKDDVTLDKIEGQKVKRSGKTIILATQYLSSEVHSAYKKMMKAMKKEVGKRLYVGSGFRAPAYQLYLFITYLSNHNYSVRETAQWNALPGFSEHGWPPRQAIDFINQEGIGEDDPEDFEKLPEYNWLKKQAGKYGFFLSYPKNNPSGISYEPWHWHYEKRKS